MITITNLWKKYRGKKKGVRIRHLFHVCFILVVFFSLLIHGVGMKTKRNLEVDNRKAASFPRWNSERPAAFAPELEQWISDRFWKRGKYIALWNAIRMHVFQESPHEQIAVGKHGFIYLASHAPGEKNRNSLINSILVWDDARLHETVAFFLAMKKSCASARIPILFVTVPTKHSLYFDNLPDSLLRQMPSWQKGTPFYSEVLKEMRQKDAQYADQYFLDVYPEAKKYIGKAILIPSRNFHWVPGPGTHLAAHLIAQKLLRVKDDFIYDPGQYRNEILRSDLRMFVYGWLKSPAQISRLDFLPPESRSEAIPLSKHFPELFLSHKYDKLEFYVSNPSNPKAKILLFGDSFSNPLALDLARYFSEVVTIEFTALARISQSLAEEHLRDVVRAFVPDYIVTLSHNGFVFFPQACELAAGAGR